MHEYETIYLLKPDIPPAQVKSFKEKIESIITKVGGHLLSRSDWGKRKLAYEVKKVNYGQYIHLKYLAPGSIIAEVERILKLEDTVMKFITVKLAANVDVEARKAEAGQEVSAPKGLPEVRESPAPIRTKPVTETPKEEAFNEEFTEAPSESETEQEES